MKDTMVLDSAGYDAGAFDAFDAGVTALDSSSDAAASSSGGADGGGDGGGGGGGADSGRRTPTQRCSHRLGGGPTGMLTNRLDRNRRGFDSLRHSRLNDSTKSNISSGVCRTCPNFTSQIIELSRCAGLTIVAFDGGPNG